jgi:hypothetical protein
MKKILTALLVLATCVAIADQITIYNDQLALVRTNTTLELDKGMQDFYFDDITSGIQSRSIIIRPLKSTFTVLSQNYEYDLASSNAIVQKYIGKEVSITTEEASFSGVLQFSDGNAYGILENTTNKLILIKSNKVENISLAQMPENFFLKPTLHWLIKAPKQGSYPIDFSYLTRGFSWEVTYNGVWDKEAKTLNITPWVTINNTSGKAFKDMQLKLMAGDVHQAPQLAENVFYKAAGRGMAVDEAFAEESFHDYHLYTLARRVDINNNQMKQFLLFDPVDAKAYPVYTYQTFDTKVLSKIAFKNDTASKMGMPLPKGLFKVYKLDAKDDNLQFIGEDRIEHTPKDEEVTLTTGSSFDLTAITETTDRRRISKAVYEQDFEVTVKNHTEETRTIQVNHHIGGFWEIFKNNQDFEQTSASSIRFEVTVKPDEEKVITWTERHE